MNFFTCNFLHVTFLKKNLCKKKHCGNIMCIKTNLGNPVGNDRFIDEQHYLGPEQQKFEAALGIFIVSIFRQRLSPL